MLCRCGRPLIDYKAWIYADFSPEDETYLTRISKINILYSLIEGKEDKYKVICPECAKRKVLLRVLTGLPSIIINDFREERQT